MDDLVLRIVVFVVVGLVSGYLSGLFGIGGGIVRIPVFLHLLPLFGVAHAVVMHVSVGTSIALVVPAAIAATRKQVALGSLDFAFYKTWALGILAGALIGNLLLPHASTEILIAVFAAYLALVGVHQAFFKQRLSIAKQAPGGATKLGVAAAVGCAAALTGTAGGTVTTPILQAFGVAITSAIATASATGLVTGTIGTLGTILTGWDAAGRPSYCLGFVDLVIFISMLPAILIAAPLGVRTGRLLPQKWLEYSYAALLLIIAADLILKLIMSLTN
jgi:uncharacterized membrane protein YfcA